MFASEIPCSVSPTHYSIFYSLVLTEKVVGKFDRCKLSWNLMELEPGSRLCHSTLVTFISHWFWLEMILGKFELGSIFFFPKLYWVRVSLWTKMKMYLSEGQCLTNILHYLLIKLYESSTESITVANLFGISSSNIPSTHQSLTITWLR
jgi:hypothetical protein